MDVIDIIYYIKWAFTISCTDKKDRVSIDDIIDVFELSYLNDNIKYQIIAKLKNINKNNSLPNDNIISFYKRG